MTSGPAPGVAGVTPGGDAIAVDLSNGTVDLLFLTSDCKECKGCWERAARAPGADRDADRGAGGAAGVAAVIVIVTPDPATDSRRSVARLAPAGATVVMSSPAWHAYGVTKAPWRVQIRGGSIVSSAPAV